MLRVLNHAIRARGVRDVGHYVFGQPWLLTDSTSGIQVVNINAVAAPPRAVLVGWGSLRKPRFLLASVLRPLARGISQTREPWKPQPGDGISSNWLIAELTFLASMSRPLAKTHEAAH